jgi:threonine/homoserine/homoserine lactone efflux protein
MLTDFIIPGMSLALSAIAIPGPLQAYLLNITLNYGWRRGLLVVFSPLITDVPIIALTLFLLSSLQGISPDAIKLIQIAGGILLLTIARRAWAQYQAGVTFGANTSQAADGSPRRILATGIMMNFLSPGPYIFWSTVNGPLLLKGLAISPLHALAFLLAFYGTFLGGLALLVLIFDRVGRLNVRVMRGLMLATIVLLVYFGTRLIADAFGLADIQTVLVPLAIIGFAAWYHFRFIAIHL